MRLFHRNSINKDPRHLKLSKIIYLAIQIWTKVVKIIITFRLKTLFTKNQFFRYIIFKVINLQFNTALRTFCNDEHNNLKSDNN